MTVDNRKVLPEEVRDCLERLREGDPIGSKVAERIADVLEAAIAAAPPAKLRAALENAVVVQWTGSHYEFRFMLPAERTDKAEDVLRAALCADSRQIKEDARRYQKLKAAMMESPMALQSFLAHHNWHPDTFKQGIDETIDLYEPPPALRALLREKPSDNRKEG